MRQQFRVNVFGPFYFARAAVPVMKKQKSGQIVNIGSVVGLVGTARGTAYVGTKWALRGMNECWREELYPDGIKVAYRAGLRDHGVRREEGGLLRARCGVGADPGQRRPRGRVHRGPGPELGHQGDRRPGPGPELTRGRKSDSRRWRARNRRRRLAWSHRSSRRWRRPRRNASASESASNLAGGSESTARAISRYRQTPRGIQSLYTSMNTIAPPWRRPRSKYSRTGRRAAWYAPAIASGYVFRPR